MSAPAKPERTVCILLPNKEQLEVTVGAKTTGQEVLSHVSELLGVKELHFFGLTVVKDNEHIFVDLDEKVNKYFPKEWRQDSAKGAPRRALPLVFCLKVQYYVENGRLICDRKARCLYYSDIRERVLRSECRQQEALYFELAGYALQADLPDHPQQNRPREGGAAYFQPKDYFPPWILAKRGVDYLLRHGPKLHRELRGMSSRDATLLFIRESCRLEDVPVTFYRLQKDKKEERGSALLGLTLRGMQIYQEANNVRQLIYDFPWFNVGRLTFLGKKFEIQPDGLPSARKLVYYTGSPFRSRHLLQHLSNSHRLYMNLQPVLRHLRQLEEGEEKKRYRESYISDDLDLDPAGSDGSPGLSRRSTASSGIEVDTQQQGLAEGLAKPFGSAKTIQTGMSIMHWQTGNEPEGVSVDDPEEILRLAQLLKGVSVDCPVLPSETDHEGEMVELDPTSWSDSDGKSFICCVLKQKAWVSVDRHSQSLDDVRLIKQPIHFLDSPVGHSYYPANNSGKPTFYGRRSTNCLSLDTLGDEQLLEFIL
uniref:FERM domain containing 1 n=1 Tax=Paramormyrops kingsleyae TaxID=1676925 RepID=A0A3B3TB90_9TELE